MNISCGTCNKSFVIPDDKLPAGKRVAFPCPACKNRIEVDLSESGDTGPKPAGIAGDAPAPTDRISAQSAKSGEELKKQALKNLNDLPPMPQVVFKAYEIMDDPNSSTKTLADLIETDQAIATRVLKMANSAYYGMSGKVSSVQHASVVLGYKSLGELIALAGTSTLLAQTLYGYEIDAAALWRHAMRVAFGSKLIAQKKNPALENDAFSAGLIHDVGKLILDRHVLNRKKRFEAFMANGDQLFLKAERKILGFDHAAIGFDICQHWHIPETLAKAIRYHHQPARADSDYLTHIVSMANNIAHMAESEDMVGNIESGIEAMMYLIDDDDLAFLGMAEQDVARILNESISSVEKISQTIEPVN